MTIIVQVQKPTTPSQRGYVKVVDTALHKGGPFKPLLAPKKQNAGRNNQGRITVWQRGGGHKKKYRIIDWKRNKDKIPAKVERLEYDPNRSANLALLLYSDGERRYIIAPKGLQVGDTVQSGVDAPIAVGNCLPLANMPLGTVVHCVELKPGAGAQLARSAGCSIQFLARDGDHAIIRLRSGEMRKIPILCRATIGSVRGSEHNLRKLGKAGRKRWQGRRPNVRGVAMNPVDHPMGGGEGKASGGRAPCSPWGQPVGKRTGRKNKWVVRRRNSGKKGG